MKLFKYVLFTFVLYWCISSTPSKGDANEANTQEQSDRSLTLHNISLSGNCYDWLSQLSIIIRQQNPEAMFSIQIDITTPIFRIDTAITNESIINGIIREVCCVSYSNMLKYNTFNCEGNLAITAPMHVIAMQTKAGVFEVAENKWKIQPFPPTLSIKAFQARDPSFDTDIVRLEYDSVSYSKPWKAYVLTRHLPQTTQFVIATEDVHTQALTRIHRTNAELGKKGAGRAIMIER